MGYKYFIINEINKLAVLLKENYKISKITEILDKHRFTIYCEIKRINSCFLQKSILIGKLN